MYSDIFLFIIAFSIFSLYVPQGPPAFSAPQSLLCTLAVMAGLYLYCRAAFRRLSRHAARSQNAPVCAELHGAALTRAKTIALLGYAVLIVVFDLKQALPPPVWRSDFFLSLCGIAVLYALLLVIWCASHPSYRVCCDMRSTLKSYVLWHARLSGPQVLCWLFITGLLDGLSFLPDVVTAVVRDSPAATGALLAGLFIGIGIFFPWITVRLWGCREMPAGPARECIEQVLSRCGVRCARIYLWNLFGGRLISAGIMGFVPPLRYLLISPALIDLLDRDELEAVVAHETGHVRHRHMLFYLLFILGYGFLFAVCYSLLYGALITSDVFLDLALRSDGTFGLAYHAVTIAAAIGMLLLYFRLLFGFVSRNFERQADLAARAATGSCAGIIGSLEKIARSGAHSRTAPNWHHYSIAERTAFLRACESRPGLIARHGRRVRTIVLVYCLLVFGLAALLAVNRQALGDLEKKCALTFVEKMTLRLPQDPDLHFQLAGMYYEKNRFSDAVSEYRAAIRLRPDFYDACNNLAWLYATCDDRSLRNYPEALRLARLAVSLAPMPYVLDTLAECLYVNGLCRQAIIAAEEALSADPDQREHYEMQLKKFRNACSAQNEGVLYDNTNTIAL